MKALTKKQAAVLDYLKECASTYGMPPTRAQIATAFGWKSHNAAEDHLRALERKGVIQILIGTSRGIRLLDSGESAEGCMSETIDIAIELRVHIARKYRTSRAAAKAWDVSPAFVSAVLNEKKYPTDVMLKDAGFERVIQYVRRAA